MATLAAPDTTKWSLVSPHENYLGSSYAEWFAHWLNWLVSRDPDLNNDGPVVFLRGMDSRRLDGKYFFYVRVGQRRLKIFDDQAIFLPIITYSADEKNVPNCETPDKRRALVMKLMLYGNNPPANNQAMINGKNIVEANQAYKFEDYRFLSSDFDLYIPDPLDGSYGTLLGPLLDEPLNIPGISKCTVGGYTFILKGLDPGNYLINSYGIGELGYITRTCVQIEVRKRQIATGIQQLVPKGQVLPKGSDSPFVDVIKEALVRQKRHDDQLKDGLFDEINVLLDK